MALRVRSKVRRRIAEEEWRLAILRRWTLGLLTRPEARQRSRAGRREASLGCWRSVGRLAAARRAKSGGERGRRRRAQPPKSGVPGLRSAGHA